MYLERIQHTRLERLQTQSKSVEPMGEYDLYVFLAMRFGWTPTQVGALSRPFLDELICWCNAEAQYQQIKRQEREAEQNRYGKRR